MIRRITPKIDSDMGYFLLTGSMCFFTFLIAFFLDNLGIVFSIVGATGSTTVSYILPGLFLVLLKLDQPWKGKKVMALVLVVAGVLLMINSLIWITYKAVN